ncbi:protein FAM135B-like isoform X2 [Symsagittifera roscoffensis]|uniref:protein FAM135B-like isoform X2 n=1 Tax=Symsagittifera roscoffensis TaxID=84072 RepID=UPI00307BF672
MDLLEATVDLSIELVKFINVDLLSKGDYRIAVEVEPNERLKAFVQSVSRNEYAVKPEVRSNQVGLSKTLEIEFKHSRHSLDELFNIQVTFLVDPRQPIESANNTPIKLKLTLWGVAHRVAKSSPLQVRESLMEPLSERVLSLHCPVQEGLHWAAPVLFDFCHRCCVLVVVHGQMWSLSQPKFCYPVAGEISPSPSQVHLLPNGYTPVVTSQPTEITALVSENSTSDIQAAGSGGISSGDIEHVLFGRALLPTDTLQDFDRFKVMNLSKNIFYTLLVAQQSIINAIENHNPYFSPTINTASRQFDMCSKLRQSMNKVRQCECPDDIVAVVGTNLASLDAENMVLWDEFVKAATVMLCDIDTDMEILAPNYNLNTHLFTLHHQMMIQKNSEAFFYSYRQKALAAAFASSEMRQQVSEILRNHNYIKVLPPFPIECSESQLNAANMPIIFEEIYVENPTEYIIAHSPSVDVELSLNESLAYQNISGTNSVVASPSRLAEGSLVALDPSKQPMVNGKRSHDVSPNVSAPTPELNSPSNPQLIGTSNRLQLAKSALNKLSRLSSTSKQQQPPCSSCRPSLKRSFSCSSFKTEFELHLNLPEAKSRGNHEHAKPKPLSVSFSVDGKFSAFSTVLKSNRSDSSFDTTITTRNPVINAEGTSHTCSNCETRSSIRGMNRIADARDILTQFSSQVESLSSTDVLRTLQAAKNRSVSPFQAILAGAIEVENVLSFLDDVQCSRMEPLLFTPKHLEKIKRMRKQVESILRDQRIKLNWYAHLSSDLFSCTEPYFLETPNEFAYHVSESGPGCHLVICVHGLDGNCQDLRTLRTFMLMAMKLPLSKIRFLMSRANEDDTMNETLESLTNRLVDEIDEHIQQTNLIYDRISFIGHSLGALIIRAALAKPAMHKYHDRLYTYLSLAGPHLGTGYQNSKLVSAGMWVFQKLKKSPAINQLSLKDEVILEKTFVFKTSAQRSLEFFTNVLLVSSHQDKYVPPHSARIELCEKAVKDDSLFGRTYRTMVDNILSPIISKPDLKLVRYDVSFPLSTSAANNLIGRTAHIAVLDSEVWMEKFFTVVALKYFT